MGEIFERPLPEVPLEWTGERLTTAIDGQIEIEHLHRYFLARAYCRGRDVLDIACGEGYGSALMAQTALSVVGVDVSGEAVEHASLSYSRSNLRYTQGDARSIPLPDQSVDMVVSFETLEHFFEHDVFLEEVRRVLRPDGLLLLSSPERDIYSPPGSSANPYHVNELSRSEFEHLLQRHFKNIQLLSQRPFLGSTLVADDTAEGIGTITFEKRGEQHYEASNGMPRAVYLVALVSDAALPSPRHSLYIETDQIQELTSLPSLQEELRRTTAAYQALVAQCSRLEEQAQVYEQNAQSTEQRIRELNERIAAADPAIQRASSLEHEANGLRLQLAQFEQQIAAYERQAQDIVAQMAAQGAAYERQAQDILAQMAAQAAAYEQQAQDAAAQIAAQAAAYEQQVQDAAEQAADAARRIADVEKQAADAAELAAAFELEAQDAATLASARIASLEVEINDLRLQRNFLRQALRTQATRSSMAVAEAAEWRQRYEALRARLVVILHRFHIHTVSRLVPKPIKRFARNRLLGGHRS